MYFCLWYIYRYTAWSWKSDNNLWELILFLHQVANVNQIQVISLSGKHFICRTILLALNSLFIQVFKFCVFQCNSDSFVTSVLCVIFKGIYQFSAVNFFSYVRILKFYLCFSVTSFHFHMCCKLRV